MEDRTLVHGPLEFLFTVDEETGLTGAASLEHDFLASRTLMNLDSEEEGSLYVGCSGGRDTTGTWKATLEAAPKGAVAAHLMVAGLKGGHSGLEIDQGRGNAIKIMNRALLALESLGARLAAIAGGNKRNAIPRECGATVYLPARAWDDAVKTVRALQEAAKAEIATADPDLRITLEAQKATRQGKVVPKTVQRKLLATISALPHGVTKMSADIPGLVETSTNVAVIETGRKGIVLATSQRSSVESEINEICHTVASIFALGGAAIEQADGYPGWKPDLKSPILKVAKQTYRQLYGKDAEVKAIHAGLECGIIGERIPGMDMVSFGPTLEGVHSPDERIHIDTVERFFDYLLAILKNVN
jgi:dipeptidase D